jgi:hypothetical protein
VHAIWSTAEHNAPKLHLLWVVVVVVVVVAAMVVIAVGAFALKTGSDAIIYHVPHSQELACQGYKSKLYT